MIEKLKRNAQVKTFFMAQLAPWGSKWAVNKCKVVVLGDNGYALLRLTFF